MSALYLANPGGNEIAFVDGRIAPPLVKKYGPYTVYYDKDTSVKRIKTLRNNIVSNTAVWIMIYGGFTIQ